MAVKIPGDFLDQWKAAFNAGDVAGMLALYGDDVAVVPEPGARLHGKEALGAALGAFMTMAPYTLEFDSAGLVEGPATALFHGPWTFDGTGPDGPVQLAGTATIVLAKRGEGWEIVIDDFFSQA